ncbi:Hsp70 family protein [Corynebacterium hansenii]|uniref:Hsp70 family protein n=1 Tax=Corynebacterium hansenii TaxID=394964 RepID=A0ABV7ZRG8_9CORY|nr:Hsp70 family protein [Corynebacterium hansenii]WJZ01053.1 Chaperone protein DnaK [Corynebacterium hansenii]
MSGNEWILGIDFGTSNTAAAHTNPIKGVIEAVNLGHGNATMPSSVYYGSEADVEVGNVAIDRGEANPAGFIPAPKRLVPQQTFQLNGYDIDSSAPIAAVLASVVERATKEHGGVRPCEIVLTHPESWSDLEIEVLRTAARNLGVPPENIRMVSEPKAAAHYYSRAKRLEPGQRIAVFDFGGGTLDVAVLEAQDDGSFSVIAARGDQALGGKSFDAVLRGWIDEQIESSDPELLEYVRTRSPLVERHATEDSLRRAKELLSESSVASVSVIAAGEIHQFQIARSEFEELARPLIDRAVDLTRKTLADAGIVGANEIEALYLTGGSSRIPAVQEALKSLGPLATLDDPKTVVAQGALSAVGPVLTHLRAGPPPSGPVGAEEESARASLPETMRESVIGDSPAPTKPLARAGSRSRWPLFAVVGALVAVALIGGGAWAVKSASGDSDEAVAKPTSGAATPSGENTGSSEQSPTADAGRATASPVDNALAAIPAGMEPEIGRCVESSHYRAGNPAGINCDVVNSDRMAEFFNFSREFDKPQLSFYVSEVGAKGERTSARDGNGYGDVVLRDFDRDRSTSVYVSKETYSETNVRAIYVDVEKNLIIEARHLKGPDEAIAMLRAFDLLPADSQPIPEGE